MIYFSLEKTEQEAPEELVIPQHHTDGTAEMNTEEISSLLFVYLTCLLSSESVFST